MEIGSKGVVLQFAGARIYLKDGISAEDLDRFVSIMGSGEVVTYASNGGYQRYKDLEVRISVDFVGSDRVVDAQEEQES